MKNTTCHLLASLMLAASAQAAEYYWTGAVDSHVTDPANWLVDGVMPDVPPVNDKAETTPDILVFSGAVTPNEPLFADAEYAVRGIRFESAGWTIGATNPGNILRVSHTYGIRITAPGTNAFAGIVSFGHRDTAAIGMQSDVAGVAVRFMNGFGEFAQPSGGGAIQFNGDVTVINEADRIAYSTIWNGATLSLVASITAPLYSSYPAVQLINGACLELRSPVATQLYIARFDADCTLVGVGDGPHTLEQQSRDNHSWLGKMTGNINLTIGNNGGSKELQWGSITSDYAGGTQIGMHMTLTLAADSPLGGPGAFGAGTHAIEFGRSNNGGDGNLSSGYGIQTRGPFEVGQSFNIGCDNYYHRFGTTATQVGVSTFSGDFLVGRAAPWHPTRPHLDISVGSNAWINFTGNITNYTGHTGSGDYFATIGGQVIMAGPGVARLSGVNTYRGGTFINSGTLFAASDTALGTGNATLDGGTLLLSGITLTNPVFIGENGGGIGGRGILPVTFAITNNITLCPGDFTGALNVPAQTWGSGGTYQWQINVDGFDQLFCDTTLTCEATPEAPFTITVASINDLGQPAPLDGFDPGGMYRWQIAGANALATFNPDAFVLDTTDFAAHNALHPNAVFELKFTHTGVYLVYGLSPRTLFMLR